MIGKLALAAVGANCLPGLAPLVPPLAAVLNLQTRLDGGQDVALTFDDGPHPDGTPAVLEILAAAQAKATFFLVGEQVIRYPKLAKQIGDEGHGIALHCHRHRNFLRLTPRQITTDLLAAHQAIEKATGLTPRLHRPPYGIYSTVGITVVRSRGYTPLLWSKWGRDWLANTTGPEIAALATCAIGPGDVVLLHDADYYSAPGSWQKTLVALPLILSELKRRNLSSVLL